jgi:putative membrane protein
MPLDLDPADHPICHPMKHPNLWLLAAIAPVIAWSAWRPDDWLTWWLEVLPVFLGFLALFIAQARGWRFSGLSLWLIAIHMIVLLVGGHYTYAKVPLGEWASDLIGGSRNHYDRLGHFFQGFVPAILCRELLIRHAVVHSAGWRVFCVLFFCLGFSALYELVEWAAALVSEEAAQSFLGTQGDHWDTQWDMFLAALGAVAALLLLTRAHDRSIARLSAAQSLPPPADGC